MGKLNDDTKDKWETDKRNGKISQIRMFSNLFTEFPKLICPWNLSLCHTYKILSKNCFEKYNTENAGLVCRCTRTFNLEEEAAVVWVGRRERREQLSCKNSKHILEYKSQKCKLSQHTFTLSNYFLTTFIDCIALSIY